MLDLLLLNGTVVTPDGVVNGSIGIVDGRIQHVSEGGVAESAKRVVDLHGRVVLPGLIDPHTHFGFGDDISYETMEADFQYNSVDCLLGGVTTLATTTIPGRGSLREGFDKALACAEGKSFVDYKVTPIVATLDHVQEIPELVDRGVMDFKFFPNYLGQDAVDFGMSKDGFTPDMFKEACYRLANSGRPAFAKIHAEEPYSKGILMDQARAAGVEKGLLTQWEKCTPDWSEMVQIYTHSLIAQHSGVALYPVHMSSAMTVDGVRRLRSQGMDIIGETVVMFLCSTAAELDERGAGPRAKITPPVRGTADQDALWAGIQDGTISFVGTDSLTYSSKLKDEADFWDCRVGLNLQVADTLSLLWNRGVRTGLIDVVRLAEILSSNIAKRYGIYPRKGAIRAGSDADLVVVDPGQEITLGVERLKSRADFSLWEGTTMTGAPVMTIMHGSVVMEDSEIVTDERQGRYLGPA